MDRRGLQSALSRAILGVTVGIAAWSGVPYALALSALMLWFWHAPTRNEAAAAMGGYHLAAGYSIAPGIVGFFGTSSIVFGITAWLIVATLLTLPWVLLWSAKPNVWRAPLALAITALPPLGVIGFYSPLTATGELWPASGWIGIAAFIVMAGCFTYYKRPVFMAMFITAVISNVLVPAITPVAGWYTVDTHDGGSGYGAVNRDPQQEFIAYQRLFERANNNARVLIFPEAAVPTYGKNAHAFFKQDFSRVASRSQVLIYGAQMDVPGSRVNVMVIEGAERGVWPQRMPAPVAMWRPWDSANSFPARVAGPHSFDVQGQRVAPLLCYEASLVWPALLSMRERPTVVVAIANMYWAKGTLVPRQMRACVRAWSRLFHLPSYIAENA
jgi:hypothetical protein